MYQNTQLGGFMDELTKVRKFVHKFIPRELSPTRMLEKYASDSKKKAAAKLTTANAASTSKNASADAALSKKIATLQLQTLPAIPGVTSLAADKIDQPTFNAPIAKAATPTDFTPYLWLAAFGLAGALYVIRSRK